MGDLALLNQALKAAPLTTSIGVFSVGKQVGQGGSGVVYEAVRGNKKFAIKFLLDFTTQKKNRFIDEYLGALQLEGHPNIARPLHYGEHEEAGLTFPYIVMPLYEGTLTRPNVLDYDTVFDTLEQLLAGLQHLHANGVIHRDLKPQNIFVSNGRLLIGDLGIASFDPDFFAKVSRTQKGERLANFEFSSPEQARDATAHAAMDIFSLGQILQWYCTGSTHKGTRRANFSVSDSRLRALDSLVERCIANDPNDRPQTILEVRQLLTVPANFSVTRGGAGKWDEINLFEETIRKTFPKHRGSLIAESKKLSALLKNLSQIAREARLWWADSDGGTSAIENIDLLPGEAVWLINDIEFSVYQAFIYRDDSAHTNFVILTTEGSPPFFEVERTHERHYAAIWKDRYITSEEDHNGYAEIDGEVHKLVNPASEPRTRYLNRKALLIAPNAGSAMQYGNDSTRNTLLRTIEKDRTTPLMVVEASARIFKQHLDADVDMLR